MKLLFWKDKTMRLNKYLSDAGVCSRREADRLTEAGEITVNGKRAETGMQVESGDVVVVKGKTVVPRRKKSISPSTNRAASSVLRKNGRKTTSSIICPTRCGFTRWEDSIKIPKASF